MPLRSRSPSFGTLRARLPASACGQRIGIFGGSFNPPHAGHVSIARTALQRLELARVWWLVTPGNPLKNNGSLPDERLRIEACRALLPERRMVITAFERQLGTPFTAVTLRFLRRRLPGAHLLWIMGADSLASLHRWQDWRGLVDTLPMAIIDRPGWRYRALASPAARALARRRLPEAKAATLLAKRRHPRWVFLSTRLSPLSSTALRSARGSKATDRG